MKNAFLGSAFFLLLAPLAVAARAARESDRFLREDWIATYEPTHPDYWGTYWSINNLSLGFRAIQRAKHELETRYADNWRFGGETGGAGGMALRFLVGSVLDLGLFFGDHNIHHATGHDAAAREFDRGFGSGREVPRRFKQVLPKYFGGETLETTERQPTGRGADANARAMTLPMESENMHAYEKGKELLGAPKVNMTAVLGYLFCRGRLLMDLSEIGTLNQAFIDSQTPGLGRSAVYGKGFSTDFTWYLYYLNRDRYARRHIDDYKLKMGDVKAGFYLQMIDPVWWAALYAWGHDYIAQAGNTTRLPMFSLGRGWSYLPGLRVFFSPFGVDYFQDNYLGAGGALVNAYWTVGDNRYEKRYGGGLDVSTLRFPGGGELGAYAQLHAQPLLSRITNQTALSSSEAGRLHLAYNVGGSLKVPVWTFGSGPDPARLFLYTRLGTKNLSWFPGEYFGSGLYAQTGLGARF